MRDFLFNKRPMNWKIHCDGYVCCWRRGKRIRQHRYTMEKFLGRKLKVTEHIHHINHNKTDNRIENLEILSASEHAKKHPHSIGKNRCYGEKHPRAILKNKQVVEIKRCLNSGDSQARIARKYGIDFRHVNKIARGLIHKNIL